MSLRALFSLKEGFERTIGDHIASIPTPIMGQTWIYGIPAAITSPTGLAGSSLHCLRSSTFRDLLEHALCVTRVRVTLSSCENSTHKSSSRQGGEWPFLFFKEFGANDLCRRAGARGFEWTVSARLQIGRRAVPASQFPGVARKQSRGARWKGRASVATD
jgi:hypothetical protein